MPLSLKEMRADEDALSRVGRFRCQRCLKTEPLPEGALFSRYCSGCRQYDAERAEEARKAVPGCQSSPEAFELSTAPADLGGDSSRIIGCRSDRRWYKKAGSNGDG